MRETTKTYFARFALAFPLYKVLVEQATSLLGPAQEGRVDLEPLRAFVTQKELAERLKVGSTAIGREMTRLMNGGWISREVTSGVSPKGCWRLGSRRGLKLTLLADVQAEEAIGQPGLVSGIFAEGLAAIVEKVNPAVPPVPSATPAPGPGTRRGGGRRWE